MRSSCGTRNDAHELCPVGHHSTDFHWRLDGYGIYEAASIGIPITFMRFSREFEAQADYLGVQYMYRAGYDPQAFITFFEKVQALEKRKPGAVAKVFADHPQTLTAFCTHRRRLPASCRLEMSTWSPLPSLTM